MLKPKLRISMVLIVAAFAVCGILLWFKFDLEGLVRFPDRIVAFPSIEGRYNQLLNKVAGAAMATFIAEKDNHPLELNRGHIYSRFAGCITGSVAWIYGTNQPYENVLVQYEQLFLEIGLRKYPDYLDYYSSFKEDNLSLGISLNLIDPTSSNYPKTAEHYQTVYRISIDYRDIPVGSQSRCVA